VQEFAESGLVVLHAGPRKLPRPDDHKPAFPPSYTLHVTPSNGEGGNFGGDDFQSFEDYSLRDIVAALYDVNPVSCRSPKAAGASTTACARGIQEHFRVNMTRESRTLDAYVVTAP